MLRFLLFRLSGLGGRNTRTFWTSREISHTWKGATRSSNLEDVESWGPGQDLHRTELQHLRPNSSESESEQLDGWMHKTHGRLESNRQKRTLKLPQALHAHVHQTEAEQENRVARRVLQGLRPVL